MPSATRRPLVRRDVSQHGAASVWRSLTLAYGVMVGLDSLLPLVLRVVQPGRNGLGPVALLAIGGSLLLAAHIATRRRLGWLELAGLLLVATGAAIVGRDPTLPQFTGTATTNLLVATMVAVRGRIALPTGFVLLALPVALDPDRGHGLWWQRVDLGLLEAGMLVAASVVVDAIFRAASTSDRLAEQLDEASRARQVARARDAGQEVMRRVLHDDVLTALRSVVEGVEGVERVEGSGGTTTTRRRQHVARACGEAVDAIRALLTGGLPALSGQAAHRPDGAPRVSAAALAGRVAKGSPLLITTTVVGGRPLPPAVAHALTRSAREALRNVARHAGVGEAALTVDCSGDRAEVTVTDAGCGIPPGSCEGVGITTSIRSQMLDVGGDAVLVSAHGGGTQWILRGPAAASDLAPAVGAVPVAVASDADYLDIERSRLARGVGLPLLVANLYLAVRYVPTDSDPRLEAVVALAMTLATVLVMQLVGRRLIQRAEVIAFGVVQPVLLALHMWGAGPGAATGFGSWGAGFGALPLVVLAFFTTGRGLLVLVVPYLGVLLLAVGLDPVATVGSSVGFVSSFVGVVISWFLGQRLRVSWVEVERRRAEVHRARLDDERRALLADIRSEYLDTVLEMVLPFLSAVSAGRRDPAEEAVRAEAVRLGRVTRDDIYAPGFFPPDLREAVSQFRARGGVVDIRPGCPPGTGSRQPGRLLAALVSGADAGPRQIRLTYLAGAQPRVRLAVVPALTPDELAAVAALDRVELAAAESDAFVTVFVVDDTPVTGDAAGVLVAGMKAS